MANEPTIYAFDPAKDIPSLTDKVILITGGNTGLGKRTAWELAKHSPAHIYLTARDREKGNAAVKEVEEFAAQGTKISLLQLDLSSFSSIKRAAEQFLQHEDRLDVLFLNAGIMGHKPALTEEGYEIHMGTNHLGHALLFNLLLPLLEMTAKVDSDVRVITVGSIGVMYVPDGIEYDTLKSAQSSTNQARRYSQTKLAALYYAQQISRRYPSIKAVCVNPGEVNTELFSREPGDDHMKAFQNDVVPDAVIPIEEGVKNHLWVATSPDIKGGAFYFPVGKLEPVKGYLGDEAKTQELWQWTSDALKGHIA